MNPFEAIMRWLPWRRPSLADLPPERRAKIVAAMRGHALPRSTGPDGKVHIEVEVAEDEDSE